MSFKKQTNIRFLKHLCFWQQSYLFNPSQLSSIHYTLWGLVAGTCPANGRLAETDELSLRACISTFVGGPQHVLSFIKLSPDVGVNENVESAAEADPEQGLASRLDFAKVVTSIFPWHCLVNTSLIKPFSCCTVVLIRRPLCILRWIFVPRPTVRDEDEKIRKKDVGENIFSWHKYAWELITNPETEHGGQYWTLPKIWNCIQKSISVQCIFCVGHVYVLHDLYTAITLYCVVEIL